MGLILKADVVVGTDAAEANEGQTVARRKFQPKITRFFLRDCTAASSLASIVDGQSADSTNSVSTNQKPCPDVDNL